jgi:hypothetical protein
MSTIAESERGSLEDFRGDFSELASVIEDSWSRNARTPLLYTPAFIADLFRYPGASFELAPAIYHGPQLTAFVAGYPRRLVVGGLDRRVLVVALLTASSRYRSRGYGIVAWSELVRRARSAGFDGLVNYCVEGEAMERMIEPACARLRIPVTRIHTTSYRTRVLFAGRDEGHEPAPAASALLEAAEAIVGRVPVARRWSEAEAKWQLEREGGVTASHGTGMLTGYVQPVANKDRTHCLIIEDVLWGKLAEPERGDLVRDIVSRGASAGARIALVPDLGYADLGPFADQGFRTSRTKIHAYLSLWNGPQPEGSLDGYYLDVF